MLPELAAEFEKDPSATFTIEIANQDGTPVATVTLGPMVNGKLSAIGKCHNPNPTAKELRDVEEVINHIVGQAPVEKSSGVSRDEATRLSRKFLGGGQG